MQILVFGVRYENRRHSGGVKQLTRFAALADTAQPTMALSDIEYMKKFARQVRLERAQWFFNETGITTIPSSSAAQKTLV
jgi:hypothetical protein